jgi:hypothetical protein
MPSGATKPSRERGGGSVNRRCVYAFAVNTVVGRTALLVTLAVTSLAPAAAAQEEGVFVDPDSPAGKEYAIPLEQARRDAAGGGKPGHGSEGGGESLFGAGIEPAEGGGWGSGSPDSGPDAGETPATGERSRDGSRHNRSGSSGREDAVDDRPRAAGLTLAAGRSDTLPTAGVAAGVLSAGLLIGFGLRRLFRSP